ncbi:MAG: 2-phospho-L-lactate transferase [Anaerolineales bacterium]|nr:2-phospho-L-lactate transferase [Anaerolineales bacterium]
MALSGRDDCRVLALAGGVGGAKLARGLAGILPPKNLTVAVNVADDFELYGLTICPDLDTVMYTLAGIASAETGWGIEGDTFRCLEALRQFQAPAWFRLGDRDLATHLARTRGLWDGETLTRVTRRLCETLGVEQAVLPCTDDILQTIVETEEGDLEFQEYFVRRQCAPSVRGFRLRGLDAALPTRELLAALASADAVVLCPSNPFVSLGPILALPGIREKVAAARSVAVTPIVGGEAVKGPLAKMFRELGRDSSALEAAREVGGTVRGFLLDRRDQAFAPQIEALGLQVRTTDTLMRSEADRRRVAEQALELAWALPSA